jgi:hypothetical protein
MPDIPLNRTPLAYQGITLWRGAEGMVFALAVAGRQDAKLLELRAATGLARPMRGHLGLAALCRVEERRGCLGHEATLRFLSPLIGRVGDWRAGLGRSLCSPLARPFARECHTISTVPRFQPPPRRTAAYGFPVLRTS